MQPDATITCGVVILEFAFVSNILAITSNVFTWTSSSARSSKWRTERWPTYQPEILPRFESESCSCVEATLCPAFLEMLEHHSTHTEELRRVTCGFKGFTPLVCCNQVFFPLPGAYSQQPSCNPVTTVEPRINPSPTPYHTPGVYYHTARTTSHSYKPYLNSASRRKVDEETGHPNSNRFYQDPRFRPHGNDFVTPSTFVQSTPNINPNAMSNMPMTTKALPDYFVNSHDISVYNREDTPLGQGYSNNNYPHRSLPPGYWNTGNHPMGLHESADKHHAYHHTDHNPTQTDRHYHGHTSHYFPNGHSNQPTHPQFDPREDHSKTPNYGYAVLTNSHVLPSADGSGLTSYPNVHEEDTPFQPPRTYPESQNSSTRPEMKNGSNDMSERRLEEAQWKRTMLPTDECGVSLGERIVGGKNAALGAYPWIARIGYTRSGSDSLLYRCGGSLINNRYVITAAHCVINLPGGLQLATVRLGELDERTDPDCYQSECADPVQDFIPTVVKVHTNYDRPKFRNDLALIRLDRPVNITPYVSPICLPFDSLSNKTYTGLKSLVAGWGATNLGATSSSPVLQWVTVTVVPSVGCAKAFAERTGTQLGWGQICAGGEMGRDSCEGDSGGPLMRGEDEFQRYFLLGVVSFGARRCGSENLPGVYTEIPSYLDWILDSIQP